ncbi:hypothetical protein BN1058_00319 [Paraliobacillus sp. PM-2]|nr:hypothetical protein BN1058_00319 [Paraliobacillus sp. PM-2]
MIFMTESRGGGNRYEEQAEWTSECFSELDSLREAV